MLTGVACLSQPLLTRGGDISVQSSACQRGTQTLSGESQSFRMHGAVLLPVPGTKEGPVETVAGFFSVELWFEIFL